MTTGARYAYKIVGAESLGDPTKDQIVPIPADVAPEGILNYLTARFGDPKESAVTDTENLGRLAIGWVFDGPDAPELGRRGEVIVIPMIEVDGETDGMVSMFKYQEQLRATFTSMADADPGSSLSVSLG